MLMPRNTRHVATGLVVLIVILSKQYSRLGMASLVLSSGMTCLNSLGCQANMEGHPCKIWDGRMCLQEWLPPKGPSSARILHALCALVS